MVGARWAVFGDKRGVGSDQNKWGWGDQGGSDMVDQFFGGRSRLSGDTLEEIGGGWTSDDSGGESEEGSFTEWADYLKS